MTATRAFVVVMTAHVSGHLGIPGLLGHGLSAALLGIAFALAWDMRKS